MSRPKFDHIVILIPYKDLQDPPEWLTKNFKILPGGRHGDNLTENKLIALQDGCYIELISFIDDDPAHREGHWWGKKAFGIIDFAFTNPGDGSSEYDTLQKRLEQLKPNPLDVTLGPLKSGSRKRPDGQEVKWKVTFPPAGKRGDVPFFCYDVTDRGLRIPTTTKENVQHPCRAYGVQQLVVTVPREKVQDYTKAFSTVLGISESQDVPGRFVVGSVHEVEQAKAPLVIVQPPKDEKEERLVEERGVLLGSLVLGGSGTSRGEGSPARLDQQDDMGGIFVA